MEPLEVELKVGCWDLNPVLCKKITAVGHLILLENRSHLSSYRLDYPWQSTA